MPWLVEEQAFVVTPNLALEKPRKKLALVVTETDPVFKVVGTRLFNRWCPNMQHQKKLYKWLIRYTERTSQNINNYMTLIQDWMTQLTVEGLSMMKLKRWSSSRKDCCQQSEASSIGSKKTNLVSSYPLNVWSNLNNIRVKHMEHTGE